MSTYSDALAAAMRMLAEDQRGVFMGQAVLYEGTSMSRTLADVYPDRRIEMPVFEDCQLGMAIGMSLTGLLPVCVYPRWSFLLLAASQLVLHLDCMAAYSNGGGKPRVIIRTAIPTPEPLDPGPQHLFDGSAAFRLMLTTVKVVVLDETKQIIPEYSRAMRREGSTLLVERTEFYG